MKKKFISIILMITLCLSANVVFAANDMLQMGEIVTVTNEGTTSEYEEAWFSIGIAEDGMYEFTTTVEGPYAGIELWNEAGDEFIKSGSTKYNAMEQKATMNFKCFLISGNYNLRVTRAGKHKVNYKKADADYPIDAEPNNDMKNTIPLQVNKWYSGYVDGRTAEGGFDESDLYVFNAQANTTYQLNAEATGSTYFRFLKVTENDGSKELFSHTTKENELENIYKLNNIEITFPETGTYYIDVAGMHRYNSSYTDETGYKFQISGNAGTIAEIKAPEITNTAIGVKINWENSGNLGYRIYRAEVGGVPVAISDIVYGDSFVDVNVESNKKYYYMVVPESEISVPVIDNTSATETTTETILQPENIGVKNFILMKIGNPNMTVGEKILEIDPGRGTVPVIQNGRTLVPIRAIIEAMGGTVNWSEAERKVTLNANNHNVEMWLGKKEFIVDGVKKEMDIAPDTINDRTMLPIRFATENVGCQIEWIGTTQEIIIVF